MHHSLPDSEQQRSELRVLRRRLMNVLPDITDQALWLKISTWLQRTADSSHQGSLESQVRGALAALTSDPDHKMFPHVGVDKPEDAFPDRCEGCEHYGKHCPILADRIGSQHLQRAYDVSTTDDELASALFDIASQYGCSVITTLVSDHREDLSEQKQTGHELYQRAILHVKTGWSEADLDLDIDVPDSHSGGGASGASEASTAPAGRSGEVMQEAASGDQAIQQTPPEAIQETVERVSAAVDTRRHGDEDEGEAD